MVWDYLGSQADAYLQQLANGSSTPEAVLRELRQRTCLSCIFWTDNYGERDAGFPLEHKRFVYPTALPLLPALEE